MAVLTGGAHVGPVSLGIFHTLHESDLPGGVVAVVQGHTGQGLGLPVAADVAHGGCHAGAESRECESEQSATKISKD